MSKEQRDSGYHYWPEGMLTWCEDCGNDEFLRACPVCNEELCWSCGKHHECIGDEEES